MWQRTTRVGPLPVDDHHRHPRGTIVFVQPVRYYHYISATKVDMLYGQLHHDGWGRSAEVSAGVPGILAGKRSGANRHREPNLYNKLAKVEENINRYHSPRPAGWGGPYIRDRMQLWSAVVKREHAEGSDTVLFAGYTKSELPVVLGGSAAHLLLSSGASVRIPDSSFHQVRRAVGLAAERWRSMQGDKLVEDGVVVAERPGQPFVAADSLMLDHIRYIAGLTRGRSPDFTPMGYCEFLAHEVCTLEDDYRDDAYHRRKVAPQGVLATPLYVERIDSKEEPDQLSSGDDWAWDPEGPWH